MSRPRCRRWSLLAALALSAAAPAADPPAAGTWAFQPPPDEFQADAFFDLRPLNEETAGASGFVRRSRDGADFVLGDGRPARFWAVNTYAYRKHPQFPAPDLARHARFLAKRGVNLVRMHANVTPTGNDLLAIDAAEREQLWRLVAAMRAAGIYVTFSPYWAPASRVTPALGVLDAGDGGNWGLLFFDPTLQAAYKNWLRQILVPKNPYTGRPLAQDPALAIIQLQNEDSLLFFTSQRIHGAARQELRRRFAAFAKGKYGTLEKAAAAWQNARPPPDQDTPDAFDRGEAALYIVWELTQRRGGPGQQQRLADQLEFLSRLQFDFNRMIGDYLRQELGCQQLVNAGNWRTADNVLLLDAERWSYTANDIMAVNRYYGGQHEGQNQGWAIVNGDRFTDESVLLKPRALPLTLKQVAGYPMIVPESLWVPPQGFQSEGPFLVAAYQSLTGIDACYWFATDQEAWRQPGSANGYLPSEGKWVCATPMLMGQWPAAALLFRRGYVKRGAVVVHEQRALADLWTRRMPIVAEDAGYDPNRDRDFVARESNVRNGVNPLAYLVGPVLVAYGGDPAKSQVADLTRYVDEGRQQVRANTGELLWDYGQGLCQLNAPQAQGVTGFLSKAGVFKLADVEIGSADAYASVLVVSVDGQPLRTSGKILVQVGTVARPSGWQTRPTTLKGQPAEEVVSFGRAPWQIRQAQLTVTLANTKVRAAHRLDANGRRVGAVPLTRAGAGQQFVFPPAALYVGLE